MDNNKFKRIYNNIMLVIVVAIITFILTSVFLYNKLGSGRYDLGNINGINSNLMKKIYELNTIINNEYISNVEETDLIDGAVKGYIEALGDKYTEYFTAEEMEEFKEETEGEYVGIGIYMVQDTDNNEILVLYPIEGSPAEEAGIQSGDIIKKVDNVECDADDFKTIAQNIKGKEGTKVSLEIERNENILTFNIERKKIDIYPMKYEILEKDIGYINIQSFDSDCAKEFKSIYDELAKNDIKSLIIDLRNNGGGIVEETLKIANYILEKDDVILITKDREGNETIKKNTKKPIINMPIVVLTNNNTASASEILVAALKENGKATIIGEKTYGKGVIQELITLSDKSGIKITVEEYYTPNRNKINEVGIEPDKEISLPSKVTNIYKIDRSYDTQLQEAIKMQKNN